MILNLIIAFGAGLISFLSPCVLPLIPGYISYISGESLGDIVYIELPQIGKKVDAGSEVSVIESVKAASDIYSPINGKITEVNNILSDDASIINKDSENEGCIFKIEFSDSRDLSHLMTLAEYNEFLENND